LSLFAEQPLLEFTPLLADLPCYLAENGRERHNLERIVVGNGDMRRIRSNVSEPNMGTPLPGNYVAILSFEHLGKFCTCQVAGDFQSAIASSRT
jgi:hypothetical protein